MKEWEWRVKKGLSTIRLRVFRSKAGFEESIGVSGEGGGRYKDEMPRENEFPVFSYEETQSGISRLWNGIGPGLELKTTRFLRFEQFLTPSKLVQGLPLSAR